MIMVIGGAFQGKTIYAGEKFGIEDSEWINGATCSRNEIYRARGITHFHEYLKRQVKNEEMSDTFADDLFLLNPDLIIVTNELGYGLVPVDEFDRRYREYDGRVCTRLAALSSEVDRVVCGIGTVLKSEKA